MHLAGCCTYGIRNRPWPLSCLNLLYSALELGPSPPLARSGFLCRGESLGWCPCLFLSLSLILHLGAAPLSCLRGLYLLFACATTTLLLCSSSSQLSGLLSSVVFLCLKHQGLNPEPCQDHIGPCLDNLCLLKKDVLLGSGGVHL